MALAPSAGKIVSQYNRDDIREAHEGEYRIIYRIRSNRIDILTVGHTARLLPRNLGNL